MASKYEQIEQPFDDKYQKLENYVHIWLAKLAPKTTNFQEAFEDIEKRLNYGD